MNQRLLLRLAIGLIILAVAIFGMQWLLAVRTDPDLLPGNSKGYLAALEYLPSSSKVVYFDETGKLNDVPGYRAGVRDRAPEWRPDGQRLFFASNREENVFHIFRWRPGSTPERRTIGKRTRSTPTFGFPDDPDANKTGLITSGGLILEFDPAKGSTSQLLPPPTGEAATGDESGSVDQFSGYYKQLGTGFDSARWTLERRYIVAIMNRDEGKLLIVQDMEPVTQAGVTAIPRPVIMIAGQQISFDVSSTGTCVVAVQGFQWINADSIPEEFIKDNRATKPWENALFSFQVGKADEPPTYFAATKDPKQAFDDPTISPAGDAVLFTLGTLAETGDYKGLQLRNAPLPFSPDSTGIEVLTGDVKEINWRPDGKRIAYIRTDAGSRRIFTNLPGGGDEVALSPEGRNFGFPKFSPQIASQAAN